MNLLRLGPADHGKRIDYDTFAAAAWEEGYQYELVDGRLYVLPRPEFPQSFIEGWIYRSLDGYSEENPEIINYVSFNAWLFISGRSSVTALQPDVAAYENVPLDRIFDQLRWQDLSPVLAVEVLSLDDPDKDLVRNVELYRQVPTIREYWIIDTRRSVAEPTMYVYRRRGKRWERRLEVHFGETYETRLLPRFKLVLDPRK